MKTYLNYALLAAGLMSFGATAGWGQMITANVPFGFQVTNKELPAGEYTVKQLQSGTPVLVLNNWRTHESAMILTSPLSATSLSTSGDPCPRMIFHCRSNACALAEVWGATSTAGVRLAAPPQSSSDKERLTVVYFDKKQAGK